MMAASVGDESWYKLTLKWEDKAKSCVSGTTTDSCSSPFSNFASILIKLIGLGTTARGTIPIFTVHSLSPPLMFP